MFILKLDYLRRDAEVNQLTQALYEGGNGVNDGNIMLTILLKIEQQWQLYKLLNK